MVWCTLLRFEWRVHRCHTIHSLAAQRSRIIAKRNENTMNQQSIQQPVTKSRNRIWPVLAMLLLSSAFSGCTRPGGEDVSKLMNQAYECKHIAIEELVKTDSLPGIYSYVGQYTFLLKFKDGEEGAKKFYKGLLAEEPLKGNDWEKWLKSEKVQDYIGDECTESSQIVLERMVEFVMPQIVEKKAEVRIPTVMPMLGWSEFMPAKKGWDITIRRDKLGGDPLMSEPIKRELLLPQQDGKTAKSKNK